MKRFILIIFFLLLIILYLPAQSNEIWGVWNTGSIQKNIDWIGLTEGKFLWNRKNDYYFFDSNFNNKGPYIYFEGGGGFYIKKIIEETIDTTSLYIEGMQVNSERRWETVYVKIILHFIEKDKIWIEVSRNDPNYPTTSWFPSLYFGDRKKVYWREKVNS